MKDSWLWITDLIDNDTTLDPIDNTSSSPAITADSSLLIDPIIGLTARLAAWQTAPRLIMPIIKLPTGSLMHVITEDVCGGGDFHRH